MRSEMTSRGSRELSATLSPPTSGSTSHMSTESEHVYETIQDEDQIPSGFPDMSGLSFDNSARPRSHPFAEPMTEPPVPSSSSAMPSETASDSAADSISTHHEPPVSGSDSMVS